MACPSCGGTGQVVIGGVPAGFGGNAGPAAIPVYGACSCPHGQAAAARSADIAWTQAEARRAREREALNAERLAEEQLHANRERIRALADHLITERPRGSRSVYRNASFRTWWPFSQPRLAVVVVERAWPVGEINPSYRKEDRWSDLLAVKMGVTRSGRFVALWPDHLHSSALVDLLQPRIEIERVSGDSDEGLELTPLRVADVLRKLEADLEAGPDADVEERELPQQKPLTVKQRNKETMRRLRQWPPEY